ncbi:MAG TPA: hypothetical protein VNN07_11370 [Candidatus Tectomicrobia bacterium]|nr:hypothetical protein [Candidatus Tectomicrobia bacterium]
MTAVHICPRCSSRDITRVPRRRVLDRMVRLLGWGVYRCYRCGRRFYDRPLDRKAS